MTKCSVQGWWLKAFAKLNKMPNHKRQIKWPFIIATAIFLGMSSNTWLHCVEGMAASLWRNQLVEVLGVALSAIMIIIYKLSAYCCTLLRSAQPQTKSPLCPFDIQRHRTLLEVIISKVINFTFNEIKLCSTFWSTQFFVICSSSNISRVWNWENGKPISATVLKVLN